MRVFVSYCKQDNAAVTEIVGWLRDAGFDVWVDVQSITPGAVWREKVRDGIQYSDCFIAILSNNYLNSKFCRMEFETAKIFHVRRRLPILLDDCWDRLLADRDFSVLCGYVAVDLHRSEFAGNQISREALIGRVIEGLVPDPDRREKIEGADIVICSLPRDQHFAHELAVSLQDLGFSTATIPEKGLAGEGISQLMYELMWKSKYNIFIVSVDCFEVSSVVGHFALASEEMQLPLLAVATPQLSQSTSELAAAIAKIEKMDRVYGRVLDRQLFLSNRNVAEVAGDIVIALAEEERKPLKEPGDMRIGRLRHVLEALRGAFATSKPYPH